MTVSRGVLARKSPPLTPWRVGLSKPVSLVRWPSGEAGWTSVRFPAQRRFGSAFPLKSYGLRTFVLTIVSSGTV